MTPEEITELDHRRVYEVSVKGLALDEQGRALVIRDIKDRWELPGGGLDDGEDVLGCLKRECLEELGVECEIPDTRPLNVWVGKLATGHLRLIVLYRIQINNIDFRKTEEAQEVKYVAREELNSLNLVPQLNKLKEIPW